jgi:hypothetical protein
MYMHPDMGRLLIRAKLEEAQPRMLPARLLRAESLEQQEQPPTAAAGRAPIPAALERRPAPRARLIARPSVARARAQDCDHASPQRDATHAR